MADFSLSRSTRIQAAPSRVHPLLDDFREWQKWSPWEGLDPDLKRDFSGPDHGVGSTYRWSGNKKAGEGEMRMTASSPVAVAVDLDRSEDPNAHPLPSSTLFVSKGGSQRIPPGRARRGIDRRSGHRERIVTARSCLITRCGYPEGAGPSNPRRSRR